MSLPLYDLLALGAAGCWALTSILSAEPARHMGAFAFTRWRMALVLLMLIPVVLLTGGWRTLSLSDCGALVASGIVGIFVGDTAMFAAMNRLGPRRSGVLFSMHALFGALLGFVLLDERMGWQALAGGVLVMAGVMMAILFGRHKDESHHWEANRGHLMAGISLGLLAALCQATSTLIAKPVMSQGVDPIAATVVRVSATCVAQFVLLWSGFAAAKAQHPLTVRIAALVGLIGFIGMGAGMSLILMALRYGDVGLVGILSSVTPVLLLPLLWWRLGRAPAAGAWLGAATTVLGTALVLSR